MGREDVPRIGGRVARTGSADYASFRSPRRSWRCCGRKWPVMGDTSDLKPFYYSGAETNFGGWPGTIIVVALPLSMSTPWLPEPGPVEVAIGPE